MSFLFKRLKAPSFTGEVPFPKELTARRKDEISIRGMRSVAAGKKRDLTTIPGGEPDGNHILMGLSWD